MGFIDSVLSQLGRLIMPPISNIHFGDNLVSYLFHLDLVVDEEDLRKS
jgi:hypothetical protein